MTRRKRSLIRPCCSPLRSGRRLPRRSLPASMGSQTKRSRRHGPLRSSAGPSAYGRGRRRVVRGQRSEATSNAAGHESRAQWTLMNSATIEIPRFRFSEPRRNLPGRRGATTAEDRFTIAFARAYARRAESIHSGTTRKSMAFAREIPVNGYGIADLVAVAWRSVPGERFEDIESFAEVAQPCFRAFECKLREWRKAMSQASRYRFFANQSIAVIPSDIVDRALLYLDTFRAIHVGLWSFCLTSGQIRAHYTPRATKAKSDKYHLHALASVGKAAKQALPIP